MYVKIINSMMADLVIIIGVVLAKIWDPVRLFWKVIVKSLKMNDMNWSRYDQVIINRC